jgi:hypothetical protein
MTGKKTSRESFCRWFRDTELEDREKEWVEYKLVGNGKIWTVEEPVEQRNGSKLFWFPWGSLRCMEERQVWLKYRARSPKFIWAPCHVMYTAVLIGWDTANPTPIPRIWTRIRGRYWSAKIDDNSSWTPGGKVWEKTVRWRCRNVENRMKDTEAEWAKEHWIELGKPRIFEHVGRSWRRNDSEIQVVRIRFEKSFFKYVPNWHFIIVYLWHSINKVHLFLQMHLCLFEGFLSSFIRYYRQPSPAYT